MLSHFDAVVWETGDDRLTQDPEDALTDTFLLGPLPDIAVAERQQYLTLAVRDYLNEGGKLVQAGETASYFGLLGRSLGGIFYGLAGAPDQDCVITGDFFTDCLLLSDDFAQYYLGAFGRTAFAGPAGIDGRRAPLGGRGGHLRRPAVADNPLDEAGAFSLTSDVLPAEDSSRCSPADASSTYVTADGVNPFGPVGGRATPARCKADGSYQRIGRTIDLGVVRPTSPPSSCSCRSALQLDVPPRDRGGRAVGTDEWTTLRDRGRRHLRAPPTVREEGFLLGCTRSCSTT